MIGIPLGLLYANAGEWLLHKHVLHGRGKHKNSFWSFHWHDHHKTARAQAMMDPVYRLSPFHDNPQGRELLALVSIGVIHLPLFPVAPFFVGTLVYSVAHYFVVHRRAHLDPEWAREHLPWHVDHHLGPNQHANWCVTRPWFDILLGTRQPYLGTAREEQDRARWQERQADRSGRVAS